MKSHLKQKWSSIRLLFQNHRWLALNFISSMIHSSPVLIWSLEENISRPAVRSNLPVSLLI